MGEFILPAAWTIAGLAVLAGGGELLVSGAVGVAAAIRVPSLLIGLTVVAIGTSLPEFAVSVQSSYAGSTELAVGNVVGSNIFNVLFILGLAALVLPLRVTSQITRQDAPLMLGASLATLALAVDGRLGRGDGLLLILSLAAYLAWTVRRAMAETARSPEPADAAPGPRRLPRKVLFLAVGLVLLVVGSRWLIHGAADVARLWGVGDLVIGLTIVAAGTSLPEAAASISASVRGERDIAVGNVVGSNLFNLLGVLGGAAAVSPGGLAVSAEALRFDLPVMIAAAAACLPVFFTGGQISRWEGAVFLAYYFAYLAFVVATAVGSAATQAGLSAVVLLLAAPATLLLLAASVTKSLRSSRRNVSAGSDD